MKHRNPDVWQKWRELVERQRSSGLSVAAFGARHGIDVPAPVQERPAPARVAKTHTLPKLKGKRIHPLDLPKLKSKDEVLLNRDSAVSRAKRYILGNDIDPSKVTEEQILEIATIGNKDYERSGLSHDTPADERIRKMCAIAKWIIREHKPFTGQQGKGDVEGGGLFWMRKDVHAALDLIDRIPKSELDNTNTLFAQPLDGCKVDREALATALCMATKNHLTTGSVPRDSIVGIFRHETVNIKTNNCHVRHIMHLLDKYKLTPMNRNYGRPKASRSWCRGCTSRGSARGRWTTPWCTWASTARGCRRRRSRG